MKTETETTKTELSITTTTYSCEVDGCDFTTTKKRTADLHHGRHHAVDSIWTNSIEDPDALAADTFLQFSSEENFDAWNRSNDGFHENKWSGPGWYAAIDDIVPRRTCGCCSDRVIRLTPAEQIREALRHAVGELNGLLFQQNG